MIHTFQNGLELSATEKRALLADLLRQKAVRARTVPLSFAQQRLWILAQLDPGSAVYNVSRALHMQGELNVAALRQTLNTIVARHEVLRGSFDLVDGEPVQLIAPDLEIDIPVVDLERLPESERQGEVTRFVNADGQRPFDLTRGPLLRASLLKLHSNDHVLLLTMHHIVSDGWSLGILVKEMTAIYQAIIEHRPVDLPELPIQYADFARWQREWLEGEVLEEQLGYWQKHLAGAPGVLNLPIANPRRSIQTFNGGRCFKRLSPSQSAALVALSRREGATLFMTLLAAFQTLLFRYSGQEDLVVGTPIAGRNRAETEDLIGFFVNTLPLRTSVAGNPTFRELLGRVRATALGAYAHQDLPFERMVEEFHPERSLSHAPLFQVMFVLQNQPKATLDLPALKIASLEREMDSSKFDLTLYMSEDGDGLSCWLEYNSGLFAASTIERLLGHYEVLLDSAVANPDRRLSELPLLTASEQQELLVAINDTRVEFPTGQCVHELFEAQVEKTPNAIALVCGNEQLTYRELNTRSNQLANYLQRLGVGPEDRVGVCLRRTPALLIAILGTLKAGGAYVPLDPAYPQERVAFTL
ncbi:MAG: condensation domain-containing protein, partial [Acidobacteriota bacterium]